LDPRGELSRVCVVLFVLWLQAALLDGQGAGAAALGADTRDDDEQDADDGPEPGV
jgi:hypothetical protein